MTWFKVDDGLHDHPKVLALLEEKLGDAALGLWTLCGSWSASHETDGRVPGAVVRAKRGTPQKVALLVKHGLWEKDGEDAYRFHDWHVSQPLKAELEAKRERVAQRVAKHREKQPGNALQPSNGNALLTMPPTRPDPTRPDSPKSPQRESGTAALKAWLQDCVRAAYMRADQPGQKASDSQWADGCERVLEAVAIHRFASAEQACQALAEAAVAESLKPNGKLGFALQQAAFVAAPEPKPREYSLEDLRPRKQHPEVA